MELTIKQDCDGIDWAELVAVIKASGIATQPLEICQSAFEHSFAKVFLFDGTDLVGCGRSLCDGVYQGAIYDVALLPEYQGKGLGKTILTTLLSAAPHCNYILYAAPGKEAFYQKLGFSRLKTGMGLFQKQQELRDRGMLE